MARVDVAIIGAGVSGLVCASQLAAQSNVELVVLEARERLGGRLLSPMGVDLGASWVLGPQTQKLAKQLGLSIVRQRDGAYTMGGGAPRVQGGYAQMAELLAKDLPPNSIRTGCQVSAVTASDGGFELTCEQQQGQRECFAIHARHVVVALPPAVVASSISFNPPLPAERLKKMRSTATWCGDWCKVIAVFREPFWRQRGISSTVQPRKGPISLWWEGAAGSENHEQVSALIGIAFGPKASAAVASMGGGIEDESPKLRAHVLDSLSEIFGPLDQELVTCRAICWIDEKFTYAASPGRPGVGYGHTLLKQPTDSGIHFAGTETETMHGTVEGAIAAGTRTAAEILKANRQTPEYTLPALKQKACMEQLKEPLQLASVPRRRF